MWRIALLVVVCGIAKYSLDYREATVLHNELVRLNSAEIRADPLASAHLVRYEVLLKRYGWDWTWSKAPPEYALGWHANGTDGIRGMWPLFPTARSFFPSPFEKGEIASR